MKQVSLLPGLHPWHVQFSVNASDNYHCTGSLVSACSVLAPAHCFILEKVKDVMVARVGMFPKYFLEGAFVSDIASVERHPDFDEKNLANNLAVVKTISKTSTVPVGCYTFVAS